MKKYTLALVVFLFLYISCSKNDDDGIQGPGTPTVSTQDFMWKAMNIWYFWQSDVDNLADDRFATNEEYNENDVNLAERLFDLYGRRWGIETTYRIKKHSYLPKTTSKNYLIRLFYFMFSVLLYNLWILADILIWLALFGVVKEDHLVTSKLFGTILYTVDPGGG